MPRLTNKQKVQHKEFLDSESRRDKFVRLANRRVNRILTGIRLIGNLASSNYQWNKDDIRQIHSVVDKTLTQVLLKFEIREDQKKVQEFELQKTIRGRESNVVKAVSGVRKTRPADNRPALQDA